MAADPVARAGCVVLFICLLWMRHEIPAISSTNTVSTTATTSAPSSLPVPQIVAGVGYGSRPGTFVATGDNGVPPGSEFPGADVAIVTYGGVEVNGVLTVTGDILLAGQSLQSFWTNLWAQIADVCADAACVHGTPAFLTDCQCQCDDNWQDGDDCSIHDCFGRGVFDVPTATCVCYGNFAAQSYCGTQLCPNGTYTTADTCTDPATEDTTCSTSGSLYPDCMYTCASPVINTTACPVRVNWGLDLPPTSSSFLEMGVCGGGYTAAADVIVISAMKCASTNITACQEQWDLEAAICCAPGAMCGTDKCGESDAACCSLQQQDTCLPAGCAWCSGTVCAARGFAELDADCLVSTTSAIKGQWHSWEYSCMAESGDTICDIASRDTYLSIYAAECDGSDPFDGIYVLDNITADCLTAARLLVNAESWPRLQPYGSSIPGPIEIRAELWQPQCTAVLDLAITGYGVLSTLAVWRCRSDNALPARLMLVPTQATPATEWLAGGSPMFIMAEDAAGDIYCLMDGLLSSVAAAQLVGTSTATHAGVFARITEVAPEDYCGHFRLDEIAVGIRSSSTLYGLAATTDDVILNAWLVRHNLDTSILIPAAWSNLAMAVTASAF